jgi:hypothetical protein
MNQVLVAKERWDYLIVLDACRYDFFESMYRDYIQGILQKRISTGSSTGQWRDLNFPDYYDDIVYVTANPHFCQDVEVEGYTAGEHFHKVYEVWRDGWKGGLVLPELVTKAAVDIVGKHPGKRFIIHYLQPHTPYIILGDDAKGYEESHGPAGRRLIGEEDYTNAPKYKKEILKRLVKLFKGNNILGNYPEWHLRKWLKLPPRSPMEIVIREYSTKVLRNAYKANLRFALEQVAELIKHLAGRIVITSDHGELLGENRCYAHPPNSDNPILRDVPWLVINKDKADISQTMTGAEAVKTTDESSLTNADQADDQQVKDKLRELGYID